MRGNLVAVVTAHNEEDRLPATLAALGVAFAGARVVVADDASTDGTAHAALQAGAELSRAPRNIGKGGNATLAVRKVLASEPEPPMLLLCDGDLGESAGRLGPLVEEVKAGRADLAVATFARRVGGGFGLTLTAAARTIRARSGAEPVAPISGQRVLAPALVPAVLPFAHGFGMETAMTIDAVNAGFRLKEIELDLEHRATGRSAAGFAHRARQLADISHVYVSRR